MPDIGQICWCSKIPTNGEKGGNAGNGGRPGAGGNGGDAGDVFLVTSDASLSKTHMFQIANTGGKPGVNGTPGSAGKIGRGGKPGWAPVFCPDASPGKDGLPGITPDPIQSQPDDGTDGRNLVIVQN